MADRLSARDAAFLYAEEATTPMHVGGLAVFAPPRAGFGYADLVNLVRGRIARVPRSRHKVLTVPFGLGRPVWVDDADFDLAYHVRRAILPERTGGDAPRRASTRPRPAPTRACTRWWAASCPNGSTGPGRSGRSTSSTGCPTAGLR
ncbi:MAG TPA: wax ester/triacylglycerol synthase domain-containing protein [Cryptosporangiaceae bacterium]|nr:wax ester/triacylglycerol synthase domain-containing protein [Cryptosporangiaceae bacterium]